MTYQSANGPTLPRFPTAMVTLAIATTMAMLCSSSFLTWKLGDQIRTSVNAQTKVLTAAERLENYGNVLELSIKAVVATGDPEAAARYRAVQPQLREILKQLRSDLEIAGARSAASNVDRADLALIAREFQALDLASRGQLPEARRIILGDDYNYYLKIYYDGIAELEQKATEHLSAGHRRIDDYLSGILGLSVASFLSIVLGAVSVWRPAHNWARRLQRAQARTSRALMDLAAAQEQLKNANQTLFEQARVDPLTGLQSRRKFNEDIEEVFPQILQGSGAFSLIMCDVDNFKLYNDNYGHLAGDEVLRLVGETLKRSLRTDDRVYRYGGEEFVLLVRSNSVEAGRVSAERFRAVIEAMRIPHCGNNAGIITISMGLAHVESGQNYSIGQWIDQADKALYEAKRRGRNQVATCPVLAA